MGMLAWSMQVSTRDDHRPFWITYISYLYVLYIYIYLFCVQSSVLVFHLRFCFRIFETVRQSVFGNLLQSGCPSLCTVREISGGVNGGK